MFRGAELICDPHYRAVPSGGAMVATGIPKNQETDMLLTDLHYALGQLKGVKTCNTIHAIGDRVQRAIDALERAANATHKLADEAVGLFLEYRDVHGYASEDDARAKAVQEFVDAETFVEGGDA